MRKNPLYWAVIVVIAGWIFAMTGVAQDFQRTYAIAPDGAIHIWTISGDISIQGYDGRVIVVDGIKVGRDRDRIEIVDASSANRIDVGVKYPENCNCNASANFKVLVPRSISYSFENILSVSGNVRLADVTGRVKAESTSGAVEVSNVTGTVSASSISGHVDVTLRQIRGAGNMRFTSISGNVSVKAPDNLDALIEMSTLSGTLSTDFPLEVQERRYGPGRSARGRLGTGAISIRITTVSGRVSLMKALPRLPSPKSIWGSWVEFPAKPGLAGGGRRAIC